MSWEDIGFDFDRVGTKAYDDYNLPKLTVKTSASMASRIIRTDNPKPDYFYKQFVKNEQEKKKSRLTKTDVNTICEMQRKITVYENYIVAMSGMIQRRDEMIEPVLLLNDTPMDEWMNTAWRELREMKKELLKPKGNG